MAVVQSATAVRMSSNYDANSSVQMRANQRHISLLTEALQHADKPGETLNVADFGSATGLNSMKAFSAAFQAFRATSQTPILVYHCDLPSNPWSVLFTNALSSPHSYLSLPHIYVAGVGRSYYERLFPANSLSLVHTANTLHWLSTWSTTRQQLQKYIEGDSALHTELKAIAESDLNRFLSRRSEELKVGGRMVLQILTVLFKQEIRYQTLLRMEKEGLISSEPLQRDAIYVYPVSVEFITSTVAQHSSLRLISLQEYESNDEFYQRYEVDGDREKFARDRTDMDRAVNSGLRADLFKEERSEKDLLEVYFTYMEDYLREHPEPIRIKEVDAIIEKVAS